MPDAYGRMTGEDWMRLAQMGQQYQAMQLQRQHFVDQQRRIKEAEQFDADTNYNAMLYNDDTLAYGEGTPYKTRDDAILGGLRGSPKARLLGAKLALEQKQRHEDLQTINAQKGIMDWYQSHPQAKLDDIPKELYRGVHGHKAMSLFVDNLSRDEEVARKIQIARHNHDMTHNWPIFKLAQEKIRGAVASGDAETAASILEDATKKLKKSIRFGDYDPATQTITKYYNDSNSAKYQAVEKIPLSEAIEQMANMTEKDFYIMSAMDAEATRQGNLEKMKNAETWLDKNGQPYTVYSQKNPKSPNQVDIKVYSDKDNSLQVFHSWEELRSKGLREIKHVRDYLSITSAPKSLSEKEKIEAHNRNVMAFAMEAEKLGISIDENTGEVAGLVPPEKIELLQKLANHYGVNLLAGDGRVIDTSRVPFHGEKMFIPVSVLPYGVKPYESGINELLEKGSKFEGPDPKTPETTKKEPYVLTPETRQRGAVTANRAFAGYR